MIIANQNIKVITKCQQNVNYHFINTAWRRWKYKYCIRYKIECRSEIQYSITVYQKLTEIENCFYKSRNASMNKLLHLSHLKCGDLDRILLIWDKNSVFVPFSKYCYKMTHIIYILHYYRKCEQNKIYHW